MDLTTLIVGYVGGLLTLILNLRTRGELSVGSVATAVIWPLTAARDIVALVLPSITAVLGYIAAAFNKKMPPPTAPV